MFLVLEGILAGQPLLILFANGLFGPTGLAWAVVALSLTLAVAIWSLRGQLDAIASRLDASQ